ncbi:MAG: TorF family putative porin, partial [Betaproteobacteria bacterium]
MNKTILSSALAGALLALGAAAPTGAQAQTATPEASPLTFNAAVFSEYRYRGIAQTNGKPALQGGFDYSHASGFDLGTRGSN